MGDYLYYYATQSQYDEKTNLVQSPIFLSTSPKLKYTDFKVQLSYVANEADTEQKEWVFGFHKRIMEQYSGRYTTQGDEVVIMKNIPLVEPSGIAKITYTYNGLLFYSWRHKKDDK